MAELGGVDQRLLDVLNSAADDFPYKVRVQSGLRKGDPRQHGKGRAVDVQILDENGKVIPNYQNGDSFQIYEQFAQKARQKQLELHPDLKDSFRWGGYFGGNKNYGAMDLMHFDTGGSPTLGMAGGDWDKGLNQQQQAYYPTAKSSGSAATKAIDTAMAAKKAKVPVDDYSDFDDVIITPKPGEKGFALTVGGPKKSAPVDNYDDFDDLVTKPETAAMPEAAPQAPNAIVDAARDATGLTGISARAGVGILRGAKDVIDTGVRGLTSLARPVAEMLPESIGQPIVKNIDETLAADALAKKQFDERLGDSTAATIGRVGGQIGATAPLIPAAGIGAVNSALFNAAPRLSAAGEVVAAPLLNRVAAGAASGGEAGAIFGAATGQPVGENALMGVAGVPVVMAAAKVGNALVRGASNLVDKYQVQKIARAAGVEPAAARNVLQRLDEIGITPQEAANRLQGMGPRATLADIDPALTTEASGIAAAGGRPTAILKNAYNARGAGADTEASMLMDKKLGIKPDFDVERQNIVDSARKATSGDYKKGYGAGLAVDAKPVVSMIDNQLEKAVGKEASELATAKSYLYNSKGELKTDTESLHKVRQALDDTLERLPQEGTSARSSTYRAIEGVRSAVDKELKKNPFIAGADRKFAEKMAVREGLDFGRDALKRNVTIEDFDKAFSAASKEGQDAIKKGLRVAIGDAMEAAQRGELSEAQKLFSKSSANREKFRIAFGNDADEVLDGLVREASMRATERAVTSGSQTAERLAVGKRYQPSQGSSFAGNALTSGAMDVAMGAPGLMTGANVARNVGGGLLSGMRDRAANRLAVGTADLLSRSGVARDQAVNALSRIPVRNVAPLPVNNLTGLPLVAPAGQAMYSGYEQARTDVNRLIKGR